MGDHRRPAAGTIGQHTGSGAVPHRAAPTRTIARGAESVAPQAPCHIGVATRDLSEAMDVLGRAFAIGWGTPKELDQPLATPAGLVSWELRRVHSRPGPMTIELLEGSSESTWHTTELATLHHYAYWSDDVAGESERMLAGGWELEVTFPAHDGRPTGFAYLTKHASARVELTSRPASS